ncbi:hypothetical protein [Neobacillus ginsengisoli]|uniref:Uncharacterized protein n=1 Tax=Neobacillus ginsengisoli TaxID=904295 RepID=A0ABT9XYJ8_9BACI|nr:hypothetical protein [Neobacillus ginsengisoli]MDQ0200633.1 hypothetical protein [Neobacillus ginsengisoli]
MIFLIWISLQLTQLGKEYALVYFFYLSNQEGGIEMNNDFVTIGLLVLVFALFWGFTLFSEKA